MAVKLKQKQRSLVMDAIKNLWHTADMSDVYFQCIGGVVPAHKLIISAVNPRIGKLIKRNTDKIQFNYNIQAVKSVLDFLYTGEIAKHSGEDLASITEILEISHAMDIASLFDHYWPIFAKLLSIDNFLSHLNLATKYDKVNSVKEVMAFMVAHLEKIVEHQSFLQLNEKQMENLIHVAMDKNIRKVTLIECILKWGQLNQRLRSTNVLKFVESVGISKLSNRCIQGLLAHKQLANHEQLKQRLTDELTQRLHVSDAKESLKEEANCQLTNYRTTFTNVNSTNPIHVCFSLTTKLNEDFVTECQHYSFKEKVWSKKIAIIFSCRQYNYLCMLLDKCGKPHYFTRNSNERIIAYNPSKDYSVIGCIFPHKQLCGITVGNTFCFLKSNVIAQYCVDAEQWNIINLPCGNNDKSAIMSVGGNLFLYNRATQTLQRFDFDQQEWCSKRSSSEPLHPIWSKCLQTNCQGKLFFTNDKQQLITFDTCNKKWAKRADSSLTNASPVLASCDESVVIYTMRDKLVMYNYNTRSIESIPGDLSPELLARGTRDIYLSNDGHFTVNVTGDSFLPLSSY